MRTANAIQNDINTVDGHIAHADEMGSKREAQVMAARCDMVTAAENVAGAIGYETPEAQMDAGIYVGEMAVAYGDARQAMANHTNNCLVDIKYRQRLRDELAESEAAQVAAVAMVKVRAAQAADEDVTLGDQLETMADEVADSDATGGGYMPDAWYHALGDLSTSHTDIRVIWRSSRMCNHDMLILSLRMLADRLGRGV